ncbi:MAG: hypothetical protein ABI318_21665 [Chthoniobacteraceae bacterium]
MFDLAKDSIQNRILRYLQQRHCITSWRDELEKAQAQRIEVLRKQRRAQILGEHEREYKLADCRAAFTQSEQASLNEIFSSEDRGSELAKDETGQFIERLLSQRKGDALFEFNHRDRAARSRRTGDKKASAQDNRTLHFVALEWINPDRPLWMMPTPAILKLLKEQKVIEDMTPKTFVSRVRKAELRRLSAEVSSILASKKRVQSRKAQGLLDEF